jgi:hypothetical protein
MLEWDMGREEIPALECHDVDLEYSIDSRLQLLVTHIGGLPERCGTLD